MSASRNSGVMVEMTPMADRQSRVDLVKDSSVGGMCWEGGGSAGSDPSRDRCARRRSYLVDDVGVS